MNEEQIMTEGYYKKKYEDALLRAKAVLKVADNDESFNYVSTIFPELKESKDERIKRNIIAALKGVGYYDCDLTDECIAWLEKQGQTFTKKDVDDAYLKGISDAKNELEKQGEQKPAVTDFNAKDWYVSKVDGKIHDMTYNPADKVEPKFKVKYAGSEYNVLEVKDIAGVTFYGIEDEPNHIDYVLSDDCEIISGYGENEKGSPYPTKSATFSEQTSAWNEEDEKNLKRAIWYVEHSAINVVKDTMLSEWLKSIKERVQPQSKQEWSEEDENYLQSAENACEYQYGKNTSTILWLKSLKDRVKGKED